MLLLNQNDEQMNETLQDQKQKRIHAVKHKLYVLVLLVCVFFFYPFFSDSLATLRWSDFFASVFQYEKGRVSWLANAYSDDGLLWHIVAVEKQLEQQVKLQEIIQKDQKVIDIMKSESSLQKIRACSEQWMCEWFSNALRSIIPELRTFAVLSNLSGSKMAFDQKSLLENIEQQLLQDDTGKKLANMESITFSQTIPVQEKEWIYKIPFVMSLEFLSNNDFIAFLKRVEKSIPARNPVLYKIGAINYDIAKYRQNQRIDITLYAYFYR